MITQFGLPLIFVSTWFFLLTSFGRLFTSRITSNLNEQLLYGFGVGYVIWAILLYISPSQFVNNLINAGIVLGGLVSLRSFSKNTFRKYFDMLTISRLVVFVILSIVWILPVFFSGWKKDGSMIFYGVNAHDGVWHMALMETLASTASRVMPTFARYNLEGYHYLVDLTGSEFVRVFGIDSQDMVFRVYPFLFGLYALYVVRALIFALVPSEFELNNKKKILLEFFSGMLLIWGGSLAYLLPIVGLQQSVNESAFWMHQNISTWINLPLGVSFSLFIATLNLSILVYRKPGVLNVSILGLMIGSHLGIKAYGGVLLLFGGLFTGAWLVKKRFIKLTMIFLAVSSVSFLVVARSALGSPQSAGLEWNPGWFVKTMFEAPDRLNLPRWELKRLSYEASSNTLGLSALWIAGIIIFIFGNMGSRLFGLIGLFKIEKPVKELWFILLTSALLIPLLFTQSGVAWNSIQFGYYAYLLLTPLAVVTLVKLKHRHILLSVIFIILTFPTSVFSLSKLFSKSSINSYVVAKSNVQVLEELKRLDSGSVLGPYEDKAIIPALSGKPCFFCNETQSNLLQISSSSEKDQVNKLFDLPISTEEIRAFMQLNDIKYLYFPEEYSNKDEQAWNAVGLQKIISSGNASVYTLKP
jgi:hypothetical protein